jgi:hypothetical protein
MASFFRDARLPQQRVVEGVPFPVVLVPSAPASSGAGGVDKFLAAVRCERASRLEPLVRDAGGLLLRGFPATTAADFDRAVDAFGYKELPIVGSVTLRTNVAEAAGIATVSGGRTSGAVYTTNLIVSI